MNADPETELAFWVTVGRRQDDDYHELFQTFACEEVHGDYDDAVRMLEAWRKSVAPNHRGMAVRWAIWSPTCNTEGFGIQLYPGDAEIAVGHDLPTAAVRAVNAWAALARSAGRQEGP